MVAFNSESAEKNQETTEMPESNAEVVKDDKSEVSKDVEEVEMSPEQKKAKLEEHMTAGKRAMKREQYEEATDHLGSAARLAVSLNGDFSAEAFEPYLLYGRALLEVARSEDQLLAAPSDVKENDKDADAGESSAAAATTETADSCDANADVENEGDEEVDEGDEDVEDEDDESDFALAWNVLEIARKICEKQEQTKEWLLRKAEVLQAIGDVCTEDQKYDQAINDLKSCLEIQQQHCEVGDRTLANTIFSLARVYRLQDDFLTAAEHYKQAIEVLQAKIGIYEKQLAEATGAEKEDIQYELQSVKEIVEGIKLKQEDALESKAQMDQKEQMAREAMKHIKGMFEKLADDDKPVTEISVRKKRPATEEVTTESEEPAKRVKSEEEKKEELTELEEAKVDTAVTEAKAEESVASDCKADVASVVDKVVVEASMIHAESEQDVVKAD